MKRFIIFILIYAASLNTNAKNVVDVFGTDPKKSEDIIKNYAAQVGEIEAKFINEMTKLSKGGNEGDLMNVILSNKIKLINEIKHHYAFSYVDFNSIIYPNNKNKYTTIEVVSKSDNDRLRFIHKSTKLPPQKSRHDLIEKMVDYQNIESQLILNNQFDPKESKCPVYHCLPGFTHPKLKDLFTLFSANAIKEKELILSTIKNDPLAERRTAAIYLMGHFNDPYEIISFLANHILDPDDGVRNSAMRVIGVTMQNAKIHQINVLPFLNLLDSPYETDRNKALLVLLSAAHCKSSKDMIIRQGKNRLISLLRLKQPNNHDIAYALLKEISSKDFGSQNYQAWEQWFLKMDNSKS